MSRNNALEIGNNQKRRIKILELIQDTGLQNVDQIKQALKLENIEAQKATIYKDLKMIREGNQLWTSGMAQVQWMHKVRTMYAEINQEIRQLRELRDEIIETDIPETDITDVIEILEKGQHFAKAEKIRNNAKLANLTTVALRISTLDARIMAKRDSLINMITDVPLYDKLSRAQDE